MVGGRDLDPERARQEGVAARKQRVATSRQAWIPLPNTIWDPTAGLVR